MRDTMEVQRGSRRLATVKKALVALRDRYSVDVRDGDDLDAKGNIVDHEYTIEGATV